MPYGSPDRQQMDLAHKPGLKVIYSIKDWYAGSQWCPPSIRTIGDEEPQVRARVREFRNHPALLAWYLNDESRNGDAASFHVPQLAACPFRLLKTSCQAGARKAFRCLRLGWAEEKLVLTIGFRSVGKERFCFAPLSVLSDALDPFELARW
jgi:hypothetical protein